jgi:hypothetical protein
MSSHLQTCNIRAVPSNVGLIPGRTVGVKDASMQQPAGSEGMRWGSHLDTLHVSHCVCLGKMPSRGCGT